MPRIRSIRLEASRKRISARKFIYSKDIHIQQGYSYTAKVPVGFTYRHFFHFEVLRHAAFLASMCQDMQLVTPREAAMAVKIDITI